MARAAAGRAAIGAYQGWQRARDKAFSLMAGGAFADFGARSVLQLPIRLAGQGAIRVGSGRR